MASDDKSSSRRAKHDDHANTFDDANTLSHSPTRTWVRSAWPVPPSNALDDHHSDALGDCYPSLDAYTTTTAQSYPVGRVEGSISFLGWNAGSLPAAGGQAGRAPGAPQNENG